MHLTKPLLGLCPQNLLLEEHSKLFRKETETYAMLQQLHCISKVARGVRC